MARSTWRVYKTHTETKKNFAKVSSELEEMRIREQQLADEIDRLNTEKGTEAEIRKKFNVAKEGESVLYVVGSPDEVQPEIEGVGFWRNLWQKVLDFI